MADGIEGVGNRFAFARDHFLGAKTLQAIGGLKRQLLELLSAAGFVAPGLGAKYAYFTTNYLLLGIHLSTACIILPAEFPGFRPPCDISPP